MIFKNFNDNKYRTAFTIVTEILINKLSTKEFILYLEERAVFEGCCVEYIDGEKLYSKAYALPENGSGMKKEFLITEDGRVFYWHSVLRKAELVDNEQEDHHEI